MTVAVVHGGGGRNEGGDGGGDGGEMVQLEGDLTGTTWCRGDDLTLLTLLLFP